MEMFMTSVLLLLLLSYYFKSFSLLHFIIIGRRNIFWKRLVVYLFLCPLEVRTMSPVSAGGMVHQPVCPYMVWFTSYLTSGGTICPLSDLKWCCLPCVCYEMVRSNLYVCRRYDSPAMCPQVVQSTNLSVFRWYGP